MLNNFIYSKLKSLFEEKLTAGEVPQEAIVFIEDTKEIWNHGIYFATQKSIEEIENEQKLLKDIYTYISFIQYLFILTFSIFFYPIIYFYKYTI